MSRALWVLWMVTLLGACGGANRGDNTTPEQVSPIAQLRERAEASPNDAALQAELAEAEMFWVGGEADAVLPALDRALALNPSDASLHLMRAWYLDSHGLYGPMQESAIAAIEHARAGGHPSYPFIVEAALKFDVTDLAVGAEERLSAILDTLLEDSRGLSAAAYHMAAMRRLRIASRRGDQATRERVLERLGCITEWRAAGPFGPLPLTTYDRTLPAEGAGPLADRYDLGEGRGEAETFVPESHRCSVSVRSDDRDPGVTIVEAFIEVPADRAGSTVLSLHSSASYVLSIDGTEVHRVDRRRELSERLQHIPLTLTAGRHELELKLAPAPTNIEVILAALGHRGAAWNPTLGLNPPEPTRDFERALYADVLLTRGAPLEAEAVFGPLADENRPAQALAFYTRVSSNQPFVDAAAQGALSRRLIRRQAELDPTMVDAVMGAMRLEQGALERSRALESIAARFPDDPIVQYAWADELRARDQLAEAVALTERMRAMLPDSCTAVRRLFALYREQGRVGDANALVEREMQCSADSRARLQLAMRQHDFDAAREELERLRPELEDDAAAELERQIALATGDVTRADTLLDELEEDTPRAVQRVVRQIDARLADGDRAGAVRVLETAIETDPDLDPSLRSLRRDLTGESEFEPWRVDGQEVIARYEAGDRQHEDAGEVLVFDYMVTRVYPDGSARHLVHQIYRVQSEESVERQGQFRPGGDLLTLRTIKSDGRILEPEAISGLDSIPLSELAIGDYVEYELVRSEGPRYNGGYSSGGWSFDGTDQPFVFSQLIALIPADMEVVTEEIGGTPQAVVSDEGELKVYRWTMENVPSRASEPQSVPIPPYQPTLRFAVNSSERTHFDALHEAMLAQDLVHPPHVRLAQRLAREGGAGDETGLGAIQAIATWARDEIEPGPLMGMAAQMVSSRQGNPARVARYLLSLAGFDARLVLARQFGTPEPRPIAQPGLHDVPLVLVRREGEDDLYLWLGSRFAPWDFVHGAVLGMDGWVVSGGPVERVEVRGRGVRVRETEVDIWPHEDGVRVRVLEASRGEAAMGWRQNLERVPAADLERVIRESYVARLFPSSEVESLQMRGQEAPDEPFAMEYTITSRAFGRRTGDTLVIPPLFPADASGMVALASRTTSLGVSGVSSELTVRVHETAQSVNVPDVTVNAEGVAYARTSTRSGDVLTVHHRFELDTQIVRVDRYAAFARAIREISQHELSELRVQFE